MNTAHAGTVQFLANGYIPNGIDGSNIVGVDGNNGFLFNGSTYSTIDFPGATRTTPYAISGNEIVGEYIDAHHNGFGFIYDGTTWTTISGPPGAKGVIVTGISGNDIVGSYGDAKNESHGFIYNGATYTTLDDPLGADGTSLYHISGDSIVGAYYDSGGGQHAFLYNGTNWTTVTVPGSSYTDAEGVSGGIVVGGAQTPSLVGYLFNGGSYTNPHPSLGPFATGFRFNDISGNKVIGTATYSTGNTSGFIYTIPEPATLVLAAVGAGILALARRCSRMRNRASPQ